MTQDFNLIPKINNNGAQISPILNSNIKNYLIDIDGTITDDIPNAEPDRMITAIPYPLAKETLNKLYDDGHVITFFTSRTEKLRDITETWLKKYDFKYNGLIMGKPRGGNYHWIDNHDIKAIKYDGKWFELGIK